MANLTNAWANTLYDLVNRAIAPPSVTTVYLRLFTSDPGAAGSFASEVTGGSYAAQPISALMAVPSNGVGVSTASITFPSMPAVTVSHWAKCITSTGTGVTDMIEHGPLAAPVPVTAGQPFVIAAGDLSATAA